MNICIAGKNNISVEILFYLLEYGISKKKIFVIPNDIDNGKDNWQRSLLKNSRELGIDLTTLEKVCLIDDLLFISLEFDKIIDPNKFKSVSVPIKTYKIFASGANIIQFPIFFDKPNANSSRSLLSETNLLLTDL